MQGNDGPLFVTLGMFIVDEFEFKDEDGRPTGKSQKSQGRIPFPGSITNGKIGGGGTYAVLGARIWLPPDKIGMVVDKGYDFPEESREKLLGYGQEMWMFRDQPHHQTARALNSYHGDHRDFRYLTDRIRLTPRDIDGTKLGRPHSLHFICSPNRAKQIMSEVQEVNSWKPTLIYEPIPDSCVPEALPALKEVLQYIDILSPNAEEASALLSLPLPPTKPTVEQAACKFLDFGIGVGGRGSVIIRCGSMGAYAKTQGESGAWVDAYWTESEEDTRHIVDVTGAGNSFLGGLAAGLTAYTEGDVYSAVLFGTVSASFTIEQGGLPAMTPNPERHDWPLWNGDSAWRRLENLRKRHSK